jgi:hypothetical protein
MAVQHIDKPRTCITAGLLLVKVYRDANCSYLGGFACEYAGNADQADHFVEVRSTSVAQRYQPVQRVLEGVNDRAVTLGCSRSAHLPGKSLHTS